MVGEQQQAHWPDPSDSLEALFEKYKVKTAYANLIKAIQDDYMKPTIATIFANFKAILKTLLPNSGNPEPSIQRLKSLFAQMKNTSYPIADNIQALLLLAKIPPSLDTFTQIIAQTKDSSRKAKAPPLTRSVLPSIWHGLLLPWEVKGNNEKASRPTRSAQSSAKCHRITSSSSSNSPPLCLLGSKGAVAAPRTKVLRSRGPVARGLASR